MDPLVLESKKVREQINALQNKLLELDKRIKVLQKNCKHEVVAEDGWPYHIERCIKCDDVSLI